MRTLTEFSGTLIRMAANAVAQARKSLPKDAFALRVPPPPAEEVETAHPHDNASKAAPDTGVDSPTDAADERLAADAVSHVPASAEPKPPPFKVGEFKAGEEGTSERGSLSDPDAQVRKEEAVVGKDLAGQAQDGPPGEGIDAPPAIKPERPPAGSMEEAETEAAKAALDEAVSKATGTTGDRLARLREALKAVGSKGDRVRLVRVFSGEEPVTGATKIGEHYFIVDLMPQSMKQEFKTDERGGPGRRGPKRPSGGGNKGKEGSLEGSFSMESVMQDRKNERGPGGGRRPGGGGGGRGRPGGGRGAGGGGRPGGGRSGPPKGP
jgi:hypothetical protein